MSPSGRVRVPVKTPGPRPTQVRTWQLQGTGAGPALLTSTVLCGALQLPPSLGLAGRTLVRSLYSSG